jgi:DNA-binding response OmpR family regulator
MSSEPNVSPSVASVAAKGLAPSSGRRGAAPAPRLHARRVVVACPDPHLGDSLERVLRHHADELAPEGIEVRRVHDGLTCLQDIQLTRPSLLVLHARLERMAVEEILQAWDAAHPGDNLPVIVLSSAFGSDVPPGMPGAVVLRLPFDNAELVAVAARALESSEAP